MASKMAVARLKGHSSRDLDAGPPPGSPRPGSASRIDVRAFEASSVTSATALLSGTISRGPGKADYQFVYVDEMRYDPGSMCPYRNGGCTPLADLGEGRGDQTVTRRLTGLLPGTTYHYRPLARSEELGVAGPDRTFTTAAAVESRRPLFERRRLSLPRRRGSKRLRH